MANKDNNSVTLSDDTFDKLSVSEGEQKLIIDFIESASRLPCGFDSGPRSHLVAFRFLAARKFDLQRAIELYNNHQRLRRSEGLDSIDPLDEKIRKELLSEKFTVLPHRDTSGATIALFTARLHWPPDTTQRNTLKGLILQLDAATSSELTQRNGIVFIYNMTGSKYSNFDYDLSIKILNMLKGTYPARLCKVLIVTAPLWFRAPFQVLRLFVREKLRDRVFTMDLDRLTDHIPKDRLPKQLGGSYNHNHKAWLSSALSSLCYEMPAWYLTAPVLESCGHQKSASGTSAATSPDSGIIVRSASWETSHVSSEAPPGHHVHYDDFRLMNGLLIEPGSDSTHSNNHQRLPSKRSKGTAPDDSPDNISPDRLSHKKRPLSSASLPPSSPGGDLPSWPPPFHVRQVALWPSCVHTPDYPGLSLIELAAFVERCRKRGLIKEYITEVHSRKEDLSIEVFKDGQNRSRNRYVDVYCYDDSRVRLPGVENDYIHANWVDGYQQQGAFICTQGPLPGTAHHFWLMIWEYFVPIIVMTTRTVESRRTKCFQYWPMEENESITVESETLSLRITNCGGDTTDDYKTTRLSVKNLITGEERDIWHFYFLSWPDHGIPDNASGFLHYLEAVNSRYSSMIDELGYSSDKTGVPPPPIVIHCSAGIGRTGTFVTVDICLKRLADVGSVDLLGTVVRLRQQRYGCIQVPLQYVFCYRAVLESALDKGLLKDPIKMDSSSEEEDND